VPTWWLDFSNLSQLNKKTRVFKTQAFFLVAGVEIVHDITKIIFISFKKGFNFMMKDFGPDNSLILCKLKKALPD